MRRCGFEDCIAPEHQTLVDEDDVYVFCAEHWRQFEETLDELRIERDALVAQGIDTRMANRIVQERVAREVA